MADASGAPLPSQSGRPLVIAHRGAKAYRRENTPAAYKLAIEQGADMLEIDLHRARDGAVPIVHDESLEHLGGDGEVADVSLDELRALSRRVFDEAAGGEQGAAFETIPTLDEVLDEFGERVPFNLELKAAVGGRPYAGLQALALQQVTRRGILERTLFSSFFDPALAELRSLSGAARLAILVTPRLPDAIFERAEAVGAEAINPHFVLVNQDLVDEAHARGLSVYVYTVDDESQMRRLLEVGVDGIFSNRPDVLRAVVDSMRR
jgi:glycerophosphoryl diester phosphodiesterase